MKIKIVESNPINGQESLENYIGQVFETLKLKDYKKYYDIDTTKEIIKIGQVVAFIEKNHIYPSIINKNEYVIYKD